MWDGDHGFSILVFYEMISSKLYCHGGCMIYHFYDYCYGNHLYSEHCNWIHFQSLIVVFLLYEVNTGFVETTLHPVSVNACALNWWIRLCPQDPPFFQRWVPDSIPNTNLLLLMRQSPFTPWQYWKVTLFKVSCIKNILSQETHVGKFISTSKQFHLFLKWFPL